MTQLEDTIHSLSPKDYFRGKRLTIPYAECCRSLLYQACNVHAYY